jgi:hypothetical protein
MTEHHKPWYKKWWGIIIAIVILPYFLLWFIWAKTKWVLPLKTVSTVALVMLAFGYLALLGAMTPQQPVSTNNTAVHVTTTHTTAKKNTPKNTVTQAPSPSPTPKPTTTTTPKPQPAPAPTHTVIYQFSLMSGSMNSTDLQNVGISWHDPSNGNAQLPSNILGAIQQINAGNYTVTYHVSSIDLDNLYAGVNNYSNPDATIGCTILVDNNPVANETAPESGYADCSGNGLDSQSGN